MTTRESAVPYLLSLLSKVLFEAWECHCVCTHVGSDGEVGVSSDHLQVDLLVDGVFDDAGKVLFGKRGHVGWKDGCLVVCRWKMAGRGGG